VVAADLSPEEAASAIEASLDRMRTLGVPGSWHVGPSTRPTDPGVRLLAHGFEYGGNDIGMAVDLATLPERVAAPDGFAAEKVRAGDGLTAWVRTLGSGFGEGPVEAEWVGSVYRRLGYDGGGRCGTFSGGWTVGRWRRRRSSSVRGWPVSTSSLRWRGRGGGVSALP
jgi:hypothetical protein